MILSVITKQHIEEKLGRKIRYPSDFDHLAYEIERSTKQRISTNTLKRLLGSIESVREPRLFTLDVIALYLGYENWDVYVVSLSKEGNSQFDKPSKSDDSLCREIVVEELAKDSKIEFQYYPDRRVILKHIYDKTFKVVDSSNGKLKNDDIIEISAFHLNYPLIVSTVMRNGVNIGRFTAGKISGLTYLKILEK